MISRMHIAMWIFIPVVLLFLVGLSSLEVQEKDSVTENGNGNILILMR